jgi:hypothetical protein
MVDSDMVPRRVKSLDIDPTIGGFQKAVNTKGKQA